MGGGAPGEPGLWVHAEGGGLESQACGYVLKGRKPRPWERVRQHAGSELPRLRGHQPGPAGPAAAATARTSPARGRLTGWPFAGRRGPAAPRCAVPAGRLPSRTPEAGRASSCAAWQTQTRGSVQRDGTPSPAGRGNANSGEPRAWLPFSSVKSQINMQKGHVASQASRVPGCVRSRSYCAAKGDPFALNRPLKVTLPCSSRLPSPRPRGTRH